MTGKTRTYSSDQIHCENVLQYHLIDKLIHQLSYLHRATEDYDRGLAFDKKLVLEFIKNTQASEWRRLEEQYAVNGEEEFFKQLEKALKQRGMLDVLRQGIKLIPGIKFSLCFFKPASGLNEQLLALYQANILSVIDELEYSNKNDNRIDIVLFINGIPLATLECKNLSTGSTFRHAEKQYRQDRSPAGEPLLTFKRGALVHFALDEDNVSMTTHLANGKTQFLPFNRGRDNGAGNPDIVNEFRIAYLYQDQPEIKAIFSRDILLDIIGRFIHLDNSEAHEKLIFPRFQQLDAVLKMLAHAKTYGTGHNYLIQHSAGSGKSNTIAWTAHRLITLHDVQDRAIFNTAIIITDRVVLDRQLQNTVAQFERTKGIVRRIDGTSRQLKEAIEQGARIIVTTIHKFSTDHLKEISGQYTRKFAVLIDEAHGSQSGKHADNMAKTLSREELNISDDVEAIIAEYQRQRGPQANISYFAFTATPRNVTLERFGIKGSDGLPHPFHLYSMRQAIEEGFILDVLQNYMTYKAYYQLEKSIEEDPELSSRRAQRRVARFASLHPTAIAQKVEVIVEHFRRHVLKELNGQAKAMIVTQNREHALRYYFAIKKYIIDKQYVGIKALVAFSGEVNLDGELFTESALNGFKETELPDRFNGVQKNGVPYAEQYQLLIVAEKYQTGFDQPKLCAMYIDRKLDGLQAVQTLSRLNRIFRGKEQTYILDFQNTIEDIQDAFRPYYQVTMLEAITDPNQIYELEGRIKSFAIIDESEVNRFSEIYYKRKLDAQDRIFLESLVRAAVGRFEYEEDEGRQEEFRQLLKSYGRFYSFIAQVVKLEDTWLEKLFAYTAWLVRLLPNREVPPDIELTPDMLRLQAFRIEKKEQGKASLSVNEPPAPLYAIQEFGANLYTQDEERSLSEIIDSFNQRHGTEFTREDFLRFEQVNQEILRDDDLKDMLRNNPPDVVFSAFSQAFFEGAIKLFQRDNQLQNIVMTDAEARNQAIKHFFSRALREINNTDM
jgi:type I restriction enzyme R subunit